MRLVDLRGMPSHLIAAMVAAIQDEPRTILLNRAADLGGMHQDERPIPMAEDGAPTTEDLQARLEEALGGDSNG